MRPASVSKTASATGTTAWLPLDITQNPFNASLNVKLSATATYGVEYTYDDVFDSTVTPTAWPLTAIPAGSTTNKDAGLTAPIRAVRLNVAANTGSVTLTAIQGLGL